MRWMAQKHRNLRHGYELGIATSNGTKELRHHHPGWELVVVHAGTAIVSRNGWQQVLTPGDVVLFQADTLHGARAVGGGYVRMVLHFMPQLLSDALLDQLELQAESPWLGSFGQEDHQLDVRLLHRLMEAFDRASATCRIQNLLIELLEQISASPSREFHRSLPPILDEVVHFMVDHIHMNVEIHELASRFYVSAGHLRRLFLTHFACSVQQFWLQLKMEHACDLLLQNATTDEARNATGFESRSGFIRAFRRIMGFPPSSYRDFVAAGKQSPKPLQGVAHH